ncbi:30S ribosomal protein S19e [Methanolobus halotolerans]|uniref:Small ribosomal subunit protein eS19 n=1 Tax=Methanolobus halotolerans TaxID=2052935 RepID=A0A4E0PUQ0_9EURY|nr:30S ribosomal protein S19e [Methanolobus halotolerans]TGC08704.1 30S ribosomal protein S19e [Methanolobus halotolerans]
MTTAYDVPAADLISKIAGKLKENDNVNPPEWAAFVKTGVHKEMPPIDNEWWYTRCAAVLRTVNKEGPIGVERLRSVYGGKKDEGSSPSHKAKGSGSVARVVLQQLETAGLVRTLKSGRVVSPQGQSLLDNSAYEVKQELMEKIPGLAKY